MRAVAACMTVVFALATAVQWNDPDPLLWMILYAVAASFSLAACFGRLWPRLASIGALGYGVGALCLAPEVLRSSFSTYTSWKMRSAGDEMARECVGLVLCALWLTALWVWSRR